MNSGYEPGCPFCERIRNGEFDFCYGEAVAFAPLNPVTEGHLLVVPIDHARDASADPIGAGHAMALAAEIVRDVTFHGDPPWPPAAGANIITNIGELATQTVMHTHLHVVPRRHGDGLVLPVDEPAQEGSNR